MKFFLKPVLCSVSSLRTLYVGMRVSIEATPSLTNPKAASVFDQNGRALGRVPRSAELELPCEGRVTRVPHIRSDCDRPLVEIEVVIKKATNHPDPLNQPKRRILV